MVRFFLFVLTCLGFFFFGFFAVVLYPYFFITGFRDNDARYIFYLASRYVMFVIKLGCRSFKPEGKLPAGAGIIAANHSSLLDVLCMSCFGAKDIVLLAKDWPFKVPVMGSYVKAMGNVRLGDMEDVKRQIKTAFDKGLKVMIFPEGTRSADGRVRRFRSGAFMLARELGVPVIPVAIKGLGQSIPKNGVMIRRADIKISILAPVMPFEKGGMNALKMAKYVKQLIVDKLEE